MDKGVDAASQISMDTLSTFDFVVLYLAPQSWKVRSKVVVMNYLANGKKLVFNWESGGKPGEDGNAAAKQALAQLAGYGILSPVPIYFNFADCDPATINYTALDASIDSARDVVGFDRMGAYGGFAAIKHLFDTGRIKYGWQTYAWSHGQWDIRAQLRQTNNTDSIDYDEATATNYGQYPIPGPVSASSQQELFLV